MKGLKQIAWLILAMSLIVLVSTTYISYDVALEQARDEMFRKYGNRDLGTYITYAETPPFFIAFIMSVALIATVPAVFKYRTKFCMLITIGWVVTLLLTTFISSVFATKTVYSSGTMFDIGGNDTYQITAFFTDQTVTNPEHIRYHIYDMWFSTSPYSASMALMWCSAFYQRMNCTFQDNWTSNDADLYAPTVLQTALEQSGLATWNASALDGAGWWQYDGQEYDFLIFVTAQPLFPYVGFGYAPIRAMIVRADYVDCNNPFVMIHEMGHVYTCEHCVNFCIMNPTYAGRGTNLFCGTCHEYIKSQLRRWT